MRAAHSPRGQGETDAVLLAPGAAVGDEANGTPAVTVQRPPGKFSSRVLITFAGNLVPPLVGLATAPVLAHALGVEGRGSVAAATAPVFLLVTCGTLGLPDAITYALASRQGARRPLLLKACLLVMATALLGVCILAATSSALSGGSPDTRDLLLLVSLTILPSLLLGLLRATASAYQSWGLIACERLVSHGTRLVLICGLAAAGHLTPMAAALVITGAPLLGALVYTRLRLPAVVPGEGTSSARWLLSYGLKVWLGSITGFLLMRLDQTLLTPLSDARQLGLYVVAVAISELPLIINSSVRDVLFSSDAAKRTDSRVPVAARVSSSLSMLAGLAIALSLPLWFDLAFGAEFHDAQLVAVVLLAAVVLGTPGAVAGAALSARGRPELRSYALVVACVVNVGMLLLLVPVLGAVGAALATMVGNLIASNLNIFWVSRSLGLRMHHFYLLRPSDAALVRDVLLAVVWRKR